MPSIYQQLQNNSKSNLVFCSVIIRSTYVIALAEISFPFSTRAKLQQLHGKGKSILTSGLSGKPRHV